MRPLPIALLGVVLSLAAACGGSSPRSDRDTPPPAGASPSNRGVTAAAWPPTVVATRLPGAPLRFPVPSADLSDVVNVHGYVLAALVDKGAFFGGAYPALSTDDGASWYIDGPQFTRPGADGAAVTDHLTVGSGSTLAAWGRGGNMVKISNDLGRRWYQATFPAGVESVTATDRTLTVRALGNQTAQGFLTRRYVSTDDGRTWHRGGEQPTVPY